MTLFAFRCKKKLNKKERRRGGWRKGRKKYDKLGVLILCVSGGGREEGRKGVRMEKGETKKEEVAAL